MKSEVTEANLTEKNNDQSFKNKHLLCNQSEITNLRRELKTGFKYFKKQYNIVWCLFLRNMTQRSVSLEGDCREQRVIFFTGIVFSPLQGHFIMFSHSEGQLIFFRFIRKEPQARAGVPKLFYASAR